MVFSSIIFIFIFLPAVLVIYYLSPKRVKNLILLAASILFYAWGEPVYVVLMMFSAVFNYVIGIDLDQGKERLLNADIEEKAYRYEVFIRRATLIFAVAVNLFILGFFKYCGFLTETINSVFHLQIKNIELALPIGISFYTFQTLSYVIDVYRGKVQAQKNIINFSLYVTMFPQLIAGPIVRYVDIQKYLKKRKVSIPGFGYGIEYFIKGLAKKVLIANNMGLIFENIRAIPQSEMTALAAWLAMLAYTFQIYFDFSGYSDMAIGLGKMFGFQFPKNFNYPYIAKSITEFWRRWHISLSTWFREYVYIPLGGNRGGTGKHIRNLLIVWMLTGIWHGANWTFLAWGLYYGVWLIAEKYLLGSYLKKCPGFLRTCYTMLIVIVGWVFFSSDSIMAAFGVLKNMFGGAAGGLFNTKALYYLKTSAVLIVTAMICGTPYLNRLFNRLKKKKIAFGIVIEAVLFLLSIACLVYDTYNPFLYFRF